MPTATPDTGYIEKFRQHSRWWGGDACVSVRISPVTVLWFFADSFWTEPTNNVRPCTMPNNTVGVQNNDGNVMFFSGVPDGSSFFKPSEPNTKFWPHRALYRQDSMGAWCVYVYGNLVQSTGTGGPFGFKVVGTCRFKIKNPGSAPNLWNVVQEAWGNYTQDTVSFIEDFTFIADFAFIYGIKKVNGQDYPVVAVTSKADFDANNQCNWKCWNGSEWVTGISSAAPLWTDEPSGNGYSVAQDPDGIKLIHMRRAPWGAGWVNTGEVCVRTSSAFVGPFGAPQKIVQMAAPDTFFYCPNLHPAVPGGRMMSVCRNSWTGDFSPPYQYFPSFHRVTL